ncbi:MAG TPA: FAD-dependent oxidoreductase [Syntrophales bacterium]|nr:FAD-dependent oxidoreductase [Syntrophales bacterium]HOL58969.1 FAD-dependent oxidoreductase [Syntrophales bacterium]HPO34753.1 FAD-dependent oxidoreductase [Syntrophales bacterium]
MVYRPTIVIEGLREGRRVDSRLLEEEIQKAVEQGHRCIEVHAYGQHGIGGRLWKAGREEVLIRVWGSVGQRVGSMGFPNTRIEVMGPCSDDVGWLNAGAEIIVHGHAANGVGNAMAQGKIYVAGDIGARGMTMTKHNPRFSPPELWVLGSVGDFFAEFMAGGVAVICGYDTVRKDNVLGYRPCVGMVGGTIFFRGPHEGYSEEDVRLCELSNEDWQWLKQNLKSFLNAIGRSDIYGELTASKKDWKLLIARKPYEKGEKHLRTMERFRTEVWEQELGPGGLLGDIVTIPRGSIDIIATGDLRRFIPVWENEYYLPPCQSACPTGIPVRDRWSLIRSGKWEEAINLSLQYTPLPATVCGYLCPNLCLQACTRSLENLPVLDLPALGRASLNAEEPERAPASGKKIAILGGGPAGLSVAWHLWLKGHEPVIYEKEMEAGGKIREVIPKSRIPDEVLEHEIKRVLNKVKVIHLKTPMNRRLLQQWKRESEFIVIAVGATSPRKIPVPGSERAMTAYDFLRLSKCDDLSVGKKVVVIGAGNVGCDVACEAYRLGAQSVTLIDIQEPASFGAERKGAEKLGARFLWPRVTRAITEEGVQLADGELIPADMVVMAVGDVPDLSFLPAEMRKNGPFLEVDEHYLTSDPQIYAIGDSVRLGLITEAIGAGRIVAEDIDNRLRGRERSRGPLKKVIEKSRVKLAYYDSLARFDGLDSCAAQCASCGLCRDCHVCETVCPQGAISRRDLDGGGYEYVVDSEKCIGCGFCAGACPCGVWTMKENDPLE